MSSALVGFIKNDPRLAYDDASHTYALGDQRLISVTQVLGLAGAADFSSPWFSDAVKDRGTAVHKAIALDVEEVLDESSLDDDVRGAVDGWRRFIAETGAEVEQWERRLCDPALGIAGRMDGIVRIVDERGRTNRILLDIKRTLYPCAALQLAGYEDMARALYDVPVFFKRAALVLPGDGTYRLHTFIDPIDRVTWQACVRVVNWRRQHGLIAA